MPTLCPAVENNTAIQQPDQAKRYSVLLSVPSRQRFSSALKNLAGIIETERTETPNMSEVSDLERKNKEK